MSDKDGSEKTRIISRYATLLDEAKHQNMNLTKELNHTKEQLCLKEDKLKALTAGQNTFQLNVFRFVDFSFTLTLTHFHSDLLSRFFVDNLQ